MDISVILGTYNRAESLSTALRSFTTLETADIAWELIVVDNNSSDHTRAVIENFAANSSSSVKYLFEPVQGRSAALNAGIRHATGVIIAFTDDDIILHPQWLAALLQTFQRFSCAAVGGRVVPLWNAPKPDWLEMEGQQAVVNFELGDEFKEIAFAPLGANCAFRRAVFEKHGLFRLDLGVSGSEHTITCDDTEFGERLVRAGEQIVYCPSAIVYHPVDPLRATKDYFLSWYYYNGRSLTRTYGLPTEGTFYFGVPRWLYRGLMRDLAKWWTSLESRQRFQNKLKAFRAWGRIVESYRLSRLKQPNQLQPEYR